jgi:hypothetical protein
LFKRAEEEDEMLQNAKIESENQVETKIRTMIKNSLSEFEKRLN